MVKTAQQLLQERTTRIENAVALKVPDRVPLFLPFGMFAARYCGMTFQEALENDAKYWSALEKVHLDFEPDMCSLHPLDMRSNLTLKNRLYRWPGHGIGPLASPQYVEGEYMQADEYDDFLLDPSDFVMRKLLPMAYGALEGFGFLPQLTSLIYSYTHMGIVFSASPIVNSLKQLAKAAQEAADFIARAAALSQRMADLGFPEMEGTAVFAPFDIISDYLRGLRGSTMDMFRCPEKLQAAQARLLPLIIRATVDTMRMTGKSWVVIPLHRGSDEFMSLKQFETFYWPNLKELILKLIDVGLTPMVFWEGDYTKRLEYLRELPRGKIFGWFDRTDLFKAKKIIGDTMCIVGGMPISLLQTGTPQEVKAFTRKLIDNIGEGGGYIMSSYCIIENARPELVRTWVDATREYGSYS